MITLTYGGRLGNRICQYVMPRLVAEKIGFELGTPYNWNDTVSFTSPVEGKKYTNDLKVIYDGLGIGNLLERKYENRLYRFEGFWQNSYYYLPNREKILSYFNEKAPEETNKDDIVLHTRLGDYKKFGRGGTVLNQRYYMDCLAEEKFDNLYIVTDAPDDSYFNLIKQYYNPIFTKKSEKEDFWFMAGFDRIIMGNSTFSWWAAFLSNASKIYTPSCWIRNSTDLDHSLENIQNGIIVNAGFLDY